MFGFSLPKLFFTVVVIAAVWFGYKMLARRKDTDSDDSMGDTIQCSKCGAYVPAESAKNCGKAGCPFA
jgi:hypothetical protein